MRSSKKYILNLTMVSENLFQKQITGGLFKTTANWINLEPKTGVKFKRKTNFLIVKSLTHNNNLWIPFGMPSGDNLASCLCFAIPFPTMSGYTYYYLEIYRCGQ